MRKLHWVSIVLLAAPLAFVGACGDDDSSGSGTGGSGTGGGGTGGGGTGGSETGGSGTGGGETGGSGTGGGETGGGGTGGATDDGGTGGAADDGGGTGGAADDGGTSEGGGDKVCPNDYAQEVARGATCQDYCDCMADTCGTQFANVDACMAACNAMTVDQLCCRTWHCNNAKGGNAETHCQHAIGMMGQCQ
jgi:hypothetical protein